MSGFSGSLSGSLVSSSGVQGGLNRAGLNNPVGKIITGATVGGTLSEIGGGKFEDGAVTGAFAAALGEIGRDNNSSPLPRPVVSKVDMRK